MKNTFPDPKRAKAGLTQSAFIPASSQAVTANQTGDILVWDISLIVDGVAQPNERRLIKVVTLSTFLDSNGNGIAIETLAIHLEYLVCGFSDGAVRFYDFHFKIKAWFEHLWNFGDKDKLSKEEED